MGLWRYANPVAIHFGVGAIDALPSLVGQRKAAVVTFPQARAHGLVDRLQDLLGERLCGVIENTQPNPDVDGLGALYEEFWRTQQAADVIVAVGGGSALDTAKVLMVGAESGRFESLLGSLAASRPFTPYRVKRLIAVPTTSGTGSEVTGWATVWHRAAGQKYSLNLDETWPEAALVDPQLTLSLPAGPTLASSLDALSHALEAIWNIHANPVSDNHAVAAAREVLATLPALMADLGNIELRTRMSLAALTAGLAFSNTKTALAHSISYEMTMNHGLPHGIACSFTLPLVLRRAIDANADRCAVLQRVFDCALVDAADFLESFLEDLGVSTRFETYGVSAADSHRMVAQALDGARGKNFAGARNP